MINGLDIYYSKIGRGLKPISTNNKQHTVSTKGRGLKPISNKGRGCIKERGLRILQ